MNWKPEISGLRVIVLTGGTGGAKFVQGLVRVVAPEDVTIIVNTGDDFTCWGLHVSPDVDSILYALSGVLSPERGWGVEGDTFTCLDRMRQLGAPSWFQLGDQDLATHLRRTALLATNTVTEATAELVSRMGVASRVLPMSNNRVETRVSSSIGDLSFQEYFVREHYSVSVSGVRFVGAEQAQPAPGVIEAIRDAEVIFVAPSNPVTSIGPILAVPGIRDALRTTKAQVAAVSPIVGGAAVSGPAGELMRALGLPVSIAGIAKAYEDLLDLLIADIADSGTPASKQVQELGIKVVYTTTIMSSDEEKEELASVALQQVLLQGGISAIG